MKNLLHVVKINHALDYIKQYLYLLEGREFLLLSVELVKKAAILKVLSDESILVCGDAHTHVQDYVWMFEVAYDFKFFHEVLLMTMLACLQVILYGDQLTYVLSFVNLPETTLANQLKLLDVLFADQKLQPSMLLQEFVELADLCGLMRRLIVGSLPAEIWKFLG